MSIVMEHLLLVVVVVVVVVGGGGDSGDGDGDGGGGGGCCGWEEYCQGSIPSMSIPHSTRKVTTGKRHLYEAVPMLSSLNTDP